MTIAFIGFYDFLQLKKQEISDFMETHYGEGQQESD